MIPSDPWFVYMDLLERTLDAKVCARSRLAVHSGRGLGKSMFLEHVRHVIQQQPNRFEGPCRLIRGAWSNARDRDALEEWVHQPTGTLLVDDIDLITASNADISLEKLFQSSNAGPLIASFHNPDMLDNMPRAGGSVEQIRLDPWDGNWKSRVRGAVNEIMSRSARDVLVSNNEISTPWQNAVIAVTDGHPWLIGACCRYLSDLILERPDDSLLKKSDDHDSKDSDIQAICVYLEDRLVDRELPILAPNILKACTEPGISLQLAQLAKNEGPVEDAFMRKRLRDTGLVYTDHRTGILVVPSRLIRDRIIHFTEGEPADPADKELSSANSGVEIRVEILGEDPYDGFLRWATAQGEVSEKEVSGAPWRLLRSLRDAGGELRSVEQLAKDANLGSRDATRSAIQRLQNFLKKHRLVGVLDNVRRKGYRLGGFPTIGP